MFSENVDVFFEFAQQPLMNTCLKCYVSLWVDAIHNMGDRLPCLVAFGLM